MVKLIVKLPGLRKSDRTSQSASKTPKTNSTLRSRKLRAKLKKDPNCKTKLEEYKKRKNKENKDYKDKIKQLRKDNTEYDQMMKEKQKIWKQKSRKKLSDLKAINEKRDNVQGQATGKQDKDKVSSVGKKATAAAQCSIKKQAERAKKHLPESPTSWANTMPHIITTTTPRRLSKYVTVSDDIEETLQVNEVGRLKKNLQDTKERLGFSEEGSSHWHSQYSAITFKKRKQEQSKSLSKPKQF